MEHFNTNKFLTWLTVMLSVLIISNCSDNSTDSNSNESPTKVSITQAQDNPVNISTVVGDTTLTYSFTASVEGSGTVDTDTKLGFSVNSSMVDSYNDENGTSYPVMPESTYELKQSQATIASGEKSTSEIKVEITPTGSIQPHTKYLLPITMDVKSGNVQADDELKTLYIVLDATDEITQVTPINKLRILFYAIHHAGKKSQNLDKIADIIKNAKPDVVALTSVDKNTNRSGNIDQAAKLGEMSGLKEVHFSKSFDYDDGEFGNAILTKFSGSSFSQINLKNSTQRPSVSVIATLRKETPQGSTIRFGAIKLKHNHPEDALNQSKQLIDYWKNELNRKALIMAGNFQAHSPDSDVISTIREEFNAADSTFKGTFNAENKKQKRSYIFYPKNQNWEVGEFKRYCDQDASPHCAIMSVLEFK